MPDAASAFKDHFSGHAADYASHRPRYPEALFAYVASLAAVREVAWDCGTGNGQAARGLAPHIAHVVATDASAQQVAHAPPHPGVTYHVAPSTRAPLPDASADLVTVAQALHWFDFAAFYAEVRRVLKPGGILAAWAYGFQRIDPALDPLLDDFCFVRVGPYWPPERRYIDDGYRSLPFPFAEVEPPPFVLRQRWTLTDQLGYLRTWSATRRYAQAHGEDPVAQIEPALAAAWGPPDVPREVVWPLFLRVGRVA